MHIYQVGGSLRDELLGIESHDKDWVVVGAEAAELEAMGYRRKGRYFPVFMHPDTHEEYALARTERKSGAGHRGFRIHSDASVTLEQDLMRRDLTINAMARSADGTWVDPFDGRRDLRERRLRHVSAAFVEDPLRVLRVARLAAQLARFGFGVESATVKLMREVARSGELLSLSRERIFSEWRRALETDSPKRFLRVLGECSAWAQLYPEFAPFAGDARADALPTLDALLSGPDSSAEQRFAATLWDLQRRYAAREDDWQRLCERLGPPRRWLELARLACSSLPGDGTAEPEALLDWLDALDVWRRWPRFCAFLPIYQAASAQRARARPALSAAALRRVAKRLKALPNEDLRARGVCGEELGQQMHRRRLAWLRERGAAAWRP